jgi:hypothetical protein
MGKAVLFAVVRQNERDACRAIDLNGSVARIEGEFDLAGVMVVESGEVLG